MEYSIDSNGQYFLGLDGKPHLCHDTISYFGYQYQYHTVTEEEIATMLNLLETSRRSTSMDSVILNIIAEESDPKPGAAVSE
ncbi:MAG: hypothetical protein J1E64_12090 [Acetatifactor sp.]|nr:hypothetical protein [Acetatifactor sp.]